MRDFGSAVKEWRGLPGQFIIGEARYAFPFAFSTTNGVRIEIYTWVGLTYNPLMPYGRLQSVNWPE